MTLKPNVVRKVVLPSGLTLLTEHMKDTFSVSMGIFIKVGSVHETPKNSGIAHLIEHMLFKGTRTRSARQLAEVMDAIGGRTNAYTSKEHTLLHATVTKDHTEFALEFLSDVLFNHVMTVKDLELEKNVVLEEIKMVEDAADEYIHDVAEQMMWPQDSLGQLIIGPRANVAGFKLKDLKAFIRRYYRPENMVIAVAGKIRHETIKHWVEKYFKPRSNSRRSTRVIPRPRSKPGFLYIPRRSEQANFSLAYPMSGYRSDRVAVQQVIHMILGGAMSSRLFQEVREKLGLAYSIGTNASYYRDAGIFSIFAGTSPDNTEKAVKVILRELRRLSEQKLSPREIAKVKEKIYGATYLGYETAEAHMMWLGRCEIQYDKQLTIDQVIKEIHAVRPIDVRREAQRLFIDQRPTFAVIGPLKAKHQLKELVDG